MAARIIDGKAFAAGLRRKISRDVVRLKDQHGLTPGLAVIIVGEDPASKVYVSSKARQTVDVGMNSFMHELPETVSETKLLDLIDELNNREDVHGILCQLPVPRHIDKFRIIEALAPEKDVDCFSPVNTGKVALGLPGPVPCTPLGCLMLLRDTLGSLQGKHALVIGRSNLVGKPMGLLLLRENATVTTAHSGTRNLPDLCAQADIIVAAAGRPEMVKGTWIKPGATVIDVGINRVDAPERGEGKTRLVGDVEYGVASARAGAISPVPGGVGPMTVACLLANTVTTACLANRLQPPSYLTA